VDNFALLFGIAAVIWLPSGIILASAPLLGNAAAVIINALFISIAGLVGSAALNLAVASVYLNRPTTVAEVYRSTRPIIGPLFGTYLLLALLFVIPGAAVGALYLAAKSLFVIGIISFVIVGLYFLVSWSLTIPVIVAERRFAMSALRRSRGLVKGVWWRTLGILFVVALIAQVPAAALKFVWGYIPVIGVILTALTQALSAAYSAVAVMIYYFDRRCRTEDFDLHFLAEQVRSETSPTIASAQG
jgi:hypothetical protein